MIDLARSHLPPASANVRAPAVGAPPIPSEKHVGRFPVATELPRGGRLPAVPLAAGYLLTAADLSPRELDILRKLLRGLSAKQIGWDYQVGQTRVSQWVEKIKGRIGVRTLIQMGAWCERHGIREGQG